MSVERLHTYTEAAKILGISVKTLRQHVENGRIRSVLIGGGKARKHRRFTDKNLETFIKENKVRETAKCHSISHTVAPLTGMTSGSKSGGFISLVEHLAAKKLSAFNAK